MELVRDGGEPMNVFRDPARNRIIDTFDEHRPAGVRQVTGRRQTGGDGGIPPMSGNMDPETGKAVPGPTGRHSPIARVADEIFARAAERSTAT